MEGRRGLAAMFTGVEEADLLATDAEQLTEGLRRVMERMPAT